MEIANWKFKGGFTLVEFVVVIGILGFTVGATMLFLNSVLKGANQTNVTQEVKQNGQIVLDSLDRQIRGAVDAVGLDTPPDFQIIKLSRLSEDPLYIKCFVDGASGVRNNRVASAVFSGAGIPADSVFTSISNGDTVRGVNITNCRFNVGRRKEWQKPGRWQRRKIPAP